MSSVYGDAAVCSMPLAGRVRVTDMWGQGAAYAGVQTATDGLGLYRVTRLRAWTSFRRFRKKPPAS